MWFCETFCQSAKRPLSSSLSRYIYIYIYIYISRYIYIYLVSQKRSLAFAGTRLLLRSPPRPWGPTRRAAATRPAPPVETLSLSGLLEREKKAFFQPSLTCSLLGLSHGRTRDEPRVRAAARVRARRRVRVDLHDRHQLHVARDRPPYSGDLRVLRSELRDVSSPIRTLNSSDDSRSVWLSNELSIVLDRNSSQPLVKTNGIPNRYCGWNAGANPSPTPTARPSAKEAT